MYAVVRCVSLVVCCCVLFLLYVDCGVVYWLLVLSVRCLLLLVGYCLLVVVGRCWSVFVVRCCMFADCPLVVVCCWLLVVGNWLMVVGCSLCAMECCLFAVCGLSFFFLFGVCVDG